MFVSRFVHESAGINDLLIYLSGPKEMLAILNCLGSVYWNSRNTDDDEIQHLIWIQQGLSCYYCKLKHSNFKSKVYNCIYIDAHRHSRALLKRSSKIACHISMRLEFPKAEESFTSSLSFLYFTAYIKT